MTQLIDDLEAVRVHLNVERWLLHGVSWASTPGLAYALAHLDRVTEVVTLSVATGHRWEIDWITDGIAPVVPEPHERPRAALRDEERTIDGYARLLTDPSPEVRRRAADESDAWETAHLSLGPHATPGPLHPDDRHRLNFTTLVTHYGAHDCFLMDDQSILARASRLSGIPGVLVHGRCDISGPARTPWQLHRAWPGSRPEIVEDEGHGGPRRAELAMEAMDAFSRDEARPRASERRPLRRFRRPLRTTASPIRRTRDPPWWCRRRRPRRIRRQ